MRELDPDDIDFLFDGLSSGLGLRAIAQALGVPRSSLHDWIHADAERSHRARRSQEWAARWCDEEAERLLIEAKGRVEIERARLMAQHYRWRAAVLAPWQYGRVRRPAPKPDMTFADALRLLAERERAAADGKP